MNLILTPGQLVYDQLDVTELFYDDTRLPNENLDLGQFSIVGAYLNNEPQAGWSIANGSVTPDSQVVAKTIYINQIASGTLRPALAYRWLPESSGTWKFILRYNTTYPNYTWPPKLAHRSYNITMEMPTAEAIVGGQLLIARKEAGKLNFTIPCSNPVTGELFDPDPLPVTYVYRDAEGELALDVNVCTQGIAVMKKLGNETGIFYAVLDMTDALFEHYVLLTKYPASGQTVSRVDHMYLSDELQMVRNNMADVGVGQNQTSMIYPAPSIPGV